MNKFLLLLFATTSLLGEAKVTYGLSKGGRVGDQLVAYLHAKWISYQYGFPLVYRPFEHSDSFCLHDVEEQSKNGPLKTIKVRTLEQLRSRKNVLYEIPYSPECKQEFELYPFLLKNAPRINVDWGNQEFLEMIRGLLAPRTPVELLSLPKDRTTVALHIRRPVGFDAGKGYERKFPHKFLPLSFYVDHLRLLYEEGGKKPLYVFIFSNDPDPEKLASAINAALNLPALTFDFRTPEQNPNEIQILLNDFYSMMQFDCLIRPESNLSLIASKLGSQKIVIWPEHVSSKGVDRVRIERKGIPLWSNLFP